MLHSNTVNSLLTYQQILEYIVLRLDAMLYFSCILHSINSRLLLVPEHAVEYSASEKGHLPLVRQHIQTFNFNEFSESLISRLLVLESLILRPVVV